MADAYAPFDPLLDDSPLPFGAPAFDRIRTNRFVPAFEIAIAAARADIERIAFDPAPPTFENSVVALERAGSTIARLRRIFWTLSGAHAEAPLRAIEAEVGLMLTRHGTAVCQDERLFSRVRAVWSQRDALPLNEAQRRLLASSHRSFIEGGALLDTAGKDRLAAITERLSVLSTRFGQNVLAASTSWWMLLDAADCDGLPASMLGASSQRARDQGLNGHLVTLDRGKVETFLSLAHRRDLREQLWRAFVGRCDGGSHDNWPVLSEIVALRQEKAALLGHGSYADFALVDSMAGTPEAAAGLLERVWKPALVQAEAERAVLQRLADKDGVTIEPWDWRFYAEQLRGKRYALDTVSVAEALSLDRVRDAAFMVAGRLYGLSFTRRADLPGWHDDVTAWAIGRADGTSVGLLYTDFLSRPDKRGGAWMGVLRVQERLDGPMLPIVYIVANFARPAAGSPVGLSVDEARTLFHEFGHALHALLCNVTYPSQSGTAVARDFVELPSKFMEHWIVAPEVLRTIGVPEALARAIDRADKAGQGFATVEFIASAMLDLALHRATGPIDPRAFAAALLDRSGLPAAIVPRHGLTHFTHVFDGGYASQYYSYLWSEVLDADAFAAFEAAGDLFDQELAASFRREILAVGDSRDAAEAFSRFRGRAPDERALLDARGLSSPHPKARR